jgi:transcription initiation factor TFIIIB Brf1 subunit/transcription initiation factor TFIIB
MSDKRDTYIDTSHNDYSYTTKNNRNIIVDLQPYDFTDEIKHRANFIYNKMKLSVRKANKRKFLLFFCVYSAYKEFNMPVNPVYLGQIFELKQGQMQKTLSMFSPLQTGYKPVQRTISAIDYIPDYCTQLQLEEYTDDLINFTTKILDKHHSLKQDVPQTVAAGILKYYLIINGIELVDKKLLSDITVRSETTIDSMYKKISEMDTV